MIKAKNQSVGEFHEKHMGTNEYFKSVIGCFSSTGDRTVDIPMPPRVVKAVCQHILNETKLTNLILELEKDYSDKQISEYLGYFCLENNVSVLQTDKGSRHIVDRIETIGDVDSYGNYKDGSIKYLRLLAGNYISSKKAGDPSDYALACGVTKIIVDNKVKYKVHHPGAGGCVYFDEKDLFHRHDGSYVPMELYMTTDLYNSHNFSEFFNENP